MVDEFSVDEKRELLQIARETIKSYIHKNEKKYPQNQNPKFLEKRGVFITLHYLEELRGCIGYPLPIKSMLHSIVDNAIASATEDPRFNAVTSDQLDDIDIEISILSVPSEVKSVKDIKIGQDGIIVTKGFMRGLLLPQVPIEQNWNLDEYISYGCMKAGLPQDEWKRGVKIETFQATVFGEKDLKTD